MTGTLTQLAGHIGATRTAWRRARNLRAARPASVARLSPARRMRLNVPLLFGFALAVLGAAVLALSARSLPAGSRDAGAPALSILQPLLGGVTVRIPQEPGVAIVQHGGAALVVASSMAAQPVVRIDLCTGLPLRIGYPFAGSARNALIAAPGSDMPRIDLRGGSGRALQLAWNAGTSTASWIGDASAGAASRGARGTGMLAQSGWLTWQGGALRFTRRPGGACPAAGELLLQAYRPCATGTALVQAFGPGVALPALRLAPGEHLVPPNRPRALEDALLFARLQEHGLIRLGADGLVGLAPRDLAAWLAAAPGERVAMPGWESTRLNEDGRKLLERLYYRADGAYLREQVRLHNSERRLLAWRVRTNSPAQWQAASGGVPVAQDDGLPVAAMRLFARLPEGWAPWRRVAAWDDGAPVSAAVLSLDASGPAELLLAGRVRRVDGATYTVRGECDGRACPGRDTVQRVMLAPLPGATRIVLEAEPLDLKALSGEADAAYRHLRIENGRLAWHALPASSAPAREALAQVELADRNGNALWLDGRASSPAQAAGLGALLGVHREHASSVAGMLARVPGAAHAARLSVDLPLQAAAQGALECIGQRQGKWDGKTCSGGVAAPAGRQAGLVLLDAGSGDVLAAAGAGMGRLDAARWAEIRDFDRADPARSPLRLPAFQHDGGAQRAPGSTFKVISALGAEQAARRDPRLERLLQGLPLAEIDRMAQGGGYGFRTGAPSYPAHGARITNFRETLAGTRAVDGRLGLAQAMTHSVNTWFAWTAELGDRSLGGQAQGGAPGVREIEPRALDAVRPVAGMARRLGFGTPLRLDGGLLPHDFRWSNWDALQGSASQLDPIQTRHEVRQMAIGLRMQATPLQMALVAAAVGQGRTVRPRLLLELDGRQAHTQPDAALGVRLDRIRAGMKGVVDGGTAAGAFRGKDFDALRPGLFGKTGTAPTGDEGMATVWFMGWLEPGSLPGQTRRLAFAAFVSQSALTGGAHAAPVVAALLRAMAAQSPEQKGK